MIAVVISIGNELALGQTVDTNTAWLSQQLAAIGVRAVRHVTIADELEPIRSEILRAAHDAPLVLITGGLGPTEDDLTRQALAAAMGVGLTRREELVAEIRAIFEKRHRSMPDANLAQADIPAGAIPIRNTCGTAPGIRARLGNSDIFVMPGVPREMREMYTRDIRPSIIAAAGGGVILMRTIQTFGAGESDVGERIRDLMARDRNPTVGTTAQQAVIGVRIHALGDTRQQAESLLEESTALIERRLGALVFGRDQDTLADAVARMLIDRRSTVATAESCTGGLIAKSLTDVPGSSAYFIRGYVTYANEAKTRLLDVPAELIERHGAVSAPVAEAMAIGCRRHAGTDLALSVTGIAGPGGGTDAKPVGLVYIGLADGSGCAVDEHRLGDYLTREEIRDRARKTALNHLRLRLMKYLGRA